jgi:hypothetical protein
MFMRTARLAPLVVICLGLLAACASAPADTYRVHLDPAARAEPAMGRVILFFITATERPWPFTNPIDGPFFEKPQPIASIAVKDFKGGEVATLDGSSLAWPESLDRLEGKVRVQAMLDADDTERSHTEGPGNVYSDVVEVDVSALREDTIDLTLKNVVPPSAPRRDFTNLKWVTLRSELLSRFYGRDVFHRAGVALPKGYHIPQYPRQQWPTFYVIPGFGGRDDGAVDYAQMLMTEGVEEIAPIAVYVVLDPECPLGHHGFCDSANNGPRGEALVTELIPHLEAQFRLIARPEARIVTGHSSGGWASLWLQLNYPDVFGACWSSAPDPVDFSAFQMTDLYRDGSMFAMPDGGETPAYRRLLLQEEIDAGVSDVLMTVRQETGMERAIDPDGRSGQQWDAWEAMFSPRDDKSMLPRPMFDTTTGQMHQDVVEHWQRYDMAKLLEREWNRLGPVMLERVRLTVGDEDSFYLERAVMKLRDKVEALRTQHATPAGDGYIRIVPRENHNTLEPKQFMRWNEERRAYLRKHGLFDDGPPPVRSPEPREP